MATPLPASLKIASITPYVHRAAQVEKALPVIWYWCSYMILNTILAKSLQNADNESLTYTTSLMDKLEQFKTENATNDAVVDDVAGKAYVEQFGLDTFSRADNAMRANKATRQTADTFQAAITFLELLPIWDPIEPEIAAKIKFAKFHSVRILKAVRAGEDPNLSNPKQEEVPQEESLPQLDPNDAEVRMLQGDSSATGTSRQPSAVEIPDEASRLQRDLAQTSSLDQSLHPSRDTSVIAKQRQPSVVEAPDEADRLQARLAAQSARDESLHPSRETSLPRPAGDGVSPLAPQDVSSFYTGQGQSQSQQPDVSPILSPYERKLSIGGNYFPVVPDAPSAADDLLPSNTISSSLNLPSAPLGGGAVPTIPPAFSPPPTSQQQHFQTRDYQSNQPQIPPSNFVNLNPSISSPQSSTPHTYPPPPQPTHFQHPQHQPPTQPSHFAYQQSQPPPLPQTQSYQHNPYQSSSIPPPQQQQQPQQQTATKEDFSSLDEESIMKAQKQARWAISALNFEDVPTAVKALREALSILGAK